MENEKVFAMRVGKVYPLLIAKAERKGRTKQEIEDPLMKKIRYLDKLVDELAKGKTLEKVLRK